MISTFIFCNRSRVQGSEVQRLTDSGAEKVNESYVVEKNRARTQHNGARNRTEKEDIQP